MSVVEKYHVPRSQVWAGSRGGQEGRVHLHVDGKVLCRPKQIPWYPRDPHDGEQRCARCVAKAEKLGIEWPEGKSIYPEGKSIYKTGILEAWDSDAEVQTP